MAIMKNGIWQNDMDDSELDHIDNLESEIIVESGRYHLYVSYACPFAHRPLFVINYLGLNDAISVSSVGVVRYSRGWEFDMQNPDVINNYELFSEVFAQHKSDYSGKTTVPILWDKKENKIVSNDSARLAMEFATNWGDLANNKENLAPHHLNDKIVKLNEWLHDTINRKVYIAGFAKDQEIYDKSITELFDGLEVIDETLSDSKYLFGDEITLPDLYLFSSLIRFESVYEIHFKANKKLLKSYKNIYRYIYDLISIDSLKNTIHMEHLKNHYFLTHRHINPNGIIPSGPILEWYDNN